MRRAILATLIAIPTAGSAQQSVPVRYLVPELRLEGHPLTSQGLWPTNIGAIGSDGRIILAPRSSYYGIRAIDADGKVTDFHVATGFRGDNDILWAERVGRFGNDYWVYDPGNRQVAFVSRNSKVTGAIPQPTWVHPRWAERRKYPLFGGMDVLAVYPDSQFLVRPQRPRTLLDTPGFDRKRAHLLRINRDGQIQREIASFDDEHWAIWLRDSNLGQATNVQRVPFGVRTFLAVSDDASRVTLVLPPSSASDSGSIHVVSIGANGDTAFARRYPAPNIPVTAAQIDSALRNVRGFGNISASDVQKQLRDKIPPYRSFVTEVIPGFDQSTWIITRSPIDSSKAREALVLDERGEPIARVAIPVGFVAARADRSHLWGLDKAKPAVVRMSLQATPAPTVAPPPRTAKRVAGKG